MALSTSDLITIFGTAVQVLIAIAIAIWQVRRSGSSESRKEGRRALGKRFDWRWFFRQGWQFIFCVVVATAALWQTLAANETVSKSFVIEVVLYSFLLVFGLICSIITAAIAAVRPTYLKFDNAMEHLKAASVEKTRDT
jgi:magnesium-transporting ATPase (P-type)